MNGTWKDGIFECKVVANDLKSLSHYVRSPGINEFLTAAPTTAMIPQFC